MPPFTLFSILVMTAPLYAAQLEVPEEEIISCSAWNDDCPQGMYCSTTSHRCWPCVICGYIDLIFSKRIEKCICDGGNGGNLFAICPFHPPEDYERETLIYSLEDIPDKFLYKETWVYILNGSQLANECPKRQTTTTAAMTTTATATPDRSTSEGPFDITTRNHGPTQTVDPDFDYYLEDNEGDSVKTSQIDVAPLLVIAVSCVIILLTVLSIIVCECKRRKRASYTVGVRRDAEKDITDEESGRSLEMIDISSSTLVGTPSEAGPALDYSDSSTGAMAELCDCGISEVTWVAIEAKTNTLLADEKFRTVFVSYLFRDSDQAGDGFIQRISSYTPDTNLFEVIREQTEIFSLDRYSILGATLMSTELRGRFPGEAVLMEELLNVLRNSHEHPPDYETADGGENEPLGAVSI